MYFNYLKALRKSIWIEVSFAFKKLGLRYFFMHFQLLFEQDFPSRVNLIGKMVLVR